MKVPRRRLGILLKAAISLALLGYVFGRVGWRSVAEELMAADPVLVGLYVVLGAVAVLVSALKWHVLCAARGMLASRGRLVLLYFVGLFFNQLLPTSVGGDVVRGYQLGKQEGRMADAFASVFMERITGLVVLVVFAVAAVALYAPLRDDIRLVSLVAATGVAFALGLALVLSRRASAAAARWSRWSAVGRLLAKATALQSAIRLYGGQRRALSMAMVLSLAFYAVTVAITYVGCLAFGVRVPVQDLLAAVPIILLLFMLPISLGGIGLQEWAYFFVLQIIGVSPAVGLSLGLLFRLRSIAFALVGGLAYPFVRADAEEAPPSTAEKEISTARASEQAF